MVSLSAQEIPVAGPGSGSGMNIADHMLIQISKQTTDPRQEEVVGSPYLSDNFTRGKIHSTKGSLAADMRYNVYQDVVEFKQGNLTYILNPSPVILRVDFEEYKLVVGDGFKNRTYGFYAILDSGRAVLLTKKSVAYHEARPPGALESQAHPAQYANLPDTYYYQVDNGPITRVTNIKRLIAAFPDRRDQLRTFASEEKISPNKSDDLTRLFRFYNEQ